MARSSDTIRLCIDAACARHGYTNYTLENFPSLSYFRLRIGNAIAQAGANIFYYSLPKIIVVRIGLGEQTGRTDWLNINHPGFVQELATSIYLRWDFQERLEGWTKVQLQNELGRLHRKAPKTPDFTRFTHPHINQTRASLFERYQTMKIYPSFFDGDYAEDAKEQANATATP